MSNTQIATVGNYSPEDIKTMKETLAVGTNDSQFQLFLRTAVSSGLNPFLNHIYAIVYQGKMSLQIGIEGIAYLAKQKDGFQGYDAQVVYENEPFKASRNKDGVWEITHEPDVFQSEDAKIMGAYAVAYRDGFKPYTVIMKFSEVEHFLKSPIPNQQTMWKKYTADMFKKHVLKRALKGQFGIEIADDDGQPVGGGDIPSYQPTERKDITHEASHSEPDVTQEPPQQPAQTEEDKIKKARAEMKLKFAKLGITEKEAMGQFLADNGKFKDHAKPTLSELTAVLRKMDLLIEQKSAEVEELDMPLG